MLRQAQRIAIVNYLVNNFFCAILSSGKTQSGGYVIEDMTPGSRIKVIVFHPAF